MMVPLTESACSKQLDPRIKRTRELLLAALEGLLTSHRFDDISVQEITDAATVNRATFYAHYPDKFALLECLVGSRFMELLQKRGVYFDGGCPSALRGIVLGVCDYMAQTPVGCSSDPQRQLEPHLETAMVAVVKRLLMPGFVQYPREGATPELMAAVLSGAIYAAAKDWLRSPEREASEAFAEKMVPLLAPLLGEAVVSD